MRKYILSVVLMALMMPVSIIAQDDLYFTPTKKNVEEAKKARRAAKQAEEALKNCKKEITVAIMGCVVNGPGEAKDCDLGIAGSKDFCVIFKNGEVIKKVPFADAEKEFIKELKNIE
mgnify:CR=1 FL=1